MMEMKGNIPFLVFFVGALRLDGLRRREGCSTVSRHGDCTGGGGSDGTLEVGCEGVSPDWSGE